MRMRCRYQDAAELDAPGRMLSLAYMFDARQFLFIGTLETRTRRNGWAPAAQYLVLTAAAEQKGAGGVALWVHT
eukprot:514339-Pyramimonas_sp.AAC.1